MPPSDPLFQDPATLERINARLDGMEEIMSDVRDALVRLALVEERSREGKDGMERLGGRIDKQD
jgi:hypothetical protein